MIVDGRGFTIYESAAELRMVGSLGPVCVSAMGRGGEGRRRRAVVGSSGRLACCTRRSANVEFGRIRDKNNKEARHSQAARFDMLNWLHRYRPE